MQLRMAVSNGAGRQRMKHRALCVLVFPVECFVDIKGDEVILVLKFTPGPVSGAVPVGIVVVVGHFMDGYS